MTYKMKEEWFSVKCKKVLSGRCNFLVLKIRSADCARQVVTTAN